MKYVHHYKVCWIKTKGWPFFSRWKHLHVLIFGSMFYSGTKHRHMTDIFCEARKEGSGAPVTQQKLKERGARPKFSTSIPGVSDKVCDDGIWCDRKGCRRTGRGAPRRRYELLKRQSVLEELSLVLNSNKRELSTKTGTVMHRGSITGIFRRVCFHKRPVWLCFRRRWFVLKSVFIFPLGREQNTHTCRAFLMLLRHYPIRAIHTLHCGAVSLQHYAYFVLFDILFLVHTSHRLLLLLFVVDSHFSVALHVELTLKCPAETNKVCLNLNLKLKLSRGLTLCSLEVKCLINICGDVGHHAHKQFIKFIKIMSEQMKQRGWTLMQRQRYMEVQHQMAHKRSFGACVLPGRTYHDYLFRLLHRLCSHCKQTAPGFQQNRAKTTSPRRFRLRCFLSTSECDCSVRISKQEAPPCFRTTSPVDPGVEAAYVPLDCNHSVSYEC